MPFANHHAARLRDPADFDPKSFRTTHGGTIYGRKTVPATIDIIWGKLKGKSTAGSNPIPQSLRFSADRWTVAQAKAWLKRNNVHAILFEKAAGTEKADRAAPAVYNGNTEVVRAFLENVQFRAPNEEDHSVEFVAATEGGAETPWGREVLRMAGCDLSRLAANGVVVDSHDRTTIESILGAFKPRIEGRTLVGRVFFAMESPRGALAYRLATMKPEPALRAASISFLRDPKSVVMLGPGETDGEGESRVQGPAMVTNRWQPIELSLLAVGADPDALKREFFRKLEEEDGMAREKQNPTVEDPEPQDTTPEAPPPAEPTPEERSLAAAEARKKEILLITPKGLEAVAERAILEGKTVAEARQVLLAELAKRSPPAGTPEPPEPTRATSNEPPAITPKEVVSAFTG